jgi:hypothetical protein
MKEGLRRKTFYITPDTDRRLKIAAAQRDCKFSELVEVALTSYLDKIEGQAQGNNPKRRK